ncbi:hypothetical protein [Arsenicibacter rosenii]|uniref:Uncharacterized protein n=1 Tax=Arsenicibacter rosenii TaxID=1750698 RepID=A0A1S2VQ53_9BACT|nr:hypothetical protein [Arsenicibacter rosenii]OIN60899.1 hypothetical protein BLX24_02055 [Arsenicibacter rosenii]
MKRSVLTGLSLLTALTLVAQPKPPKSFSGVYPHLAMYNNEGECGTGAVVPWAGRLWVVTYGPHLPNGSSDKLYEIRPDLSRTIRTESIGGTPANRMIHPESNQLFIGPYAIDARANVRTIPYSAMPGRHTGNARHLTDPEHRIYYGTMEEGFYDVDVATLTPRLLYEDGNTKHKKGVDETGNQPTALLPGAHGKGLYSGQGVMVYSNNGEPGDKALKQFDVPAGVLAEWDGKRWQVVRRNQFVEVTGPGGITGNARPETDPIWATGWDHKSVLLGVRDKTAGWQFFRLPKASHSYDGAHGWNTEWPRIRDIGTTGKADYLMTMHGLFWHFPGTFTARNTAGIRPGSAYLKVIGDFARWNDRIVFGCDDSAQKEFLNKRLAKGNLEGPGQSNSNLWFTPLTLPDQLGPNTAEGAVWLNESVKAGETSEPFLFAGWKNRSAWVKNHGNEPLTITFEVDKTGTGNWVPLKSMPVAPQQALQIPFDQATQGEWIRTRVNKPSVMTIQFYLAGNDNRRPDTDPMFNGLARVTDQHALGGTLYGLGNDRKALGMNVRRFDNGQVTDAGYYELDGEMRLTRKNDPQTAAFIAEKFAIPKQAVTVDEASVLIVDDKGRRWRLPKGHDAFTDLTRQAALRICREVATERDLLNCHGTFYELPAENADGYAKIRPVASHTLRIHDYASYRGLLIMTGLEPENLATNEHIIVSDDKKAAVWAGVIDDLWKLGKPTGKGGPWKHTAVSANEPSDPYLIGFYDQRNLALSHNASEPVTFTLEADPVGTGVWMPYKTITVARGQTSTFTFPADFQARWIRLTSDKSCQATADLVYR